ncbi:MAG: transcriptional repressor [Clostridia bacterium]|nr:transcriptional repressor [Clostridia bacterium]
MEKLKTTKQRQAILTLIEQSGGAFSAEEIYEKMKESFPKIAVSTVYRNLERFEETGLLVRENLSDGRLRFSPASHHEHYLICTECGRRIALSDCPLEEVERKLSEQTGFLISGHSLSLYGICPVCRER